MSFSRNVQPYIDYEFAQAAQSNSANAFAHLENAHVLGQASTKWHTLAHCKMLVWAIRQRDVAEFLGQIFRIVGAATKTVFGMVPLGNTGGSNVSPLRPMKINAEHEVILNKIAANN